MKNFLKNILNQKFGFTFLVLFLLIFVGFILYLLGQPLISKTGIIKLWHGVVFSSENSQHLTDWYTPSHIIHGFLFYGILKYFFKKLSFKKILILAILIESCWEILENTDFVINRYREATISLDYFGDSILNSMSDIMSMILGFFLARKLPIIISVFLIIFLELFVGYMIHDNLSLNILMLTYPLESIKEWQSLN